MTEKVFTCRRLRYYTKDSEELIGYIHGTATACLPVVYVYEHTGSEEEAIKAFMPMSSFAVVHTGDSYLAFPLKGIGKVRIPGQKLLYRYENGKVSILESACKICKDRVKNILSGCKDCDSLKKVPQMHPTRIIAVDKARIQEVEHSGDNRSYSTKQNDKGRKPTSPMLI